MMSEGQRDGWSLLFMALVLLGTVSETRGSEASGQRGQGVQAWSGPDPDPEPDQDPDQVPAGFNRPVLQPSESAPLIGTFTLKDQAGEPCLKASLGVEYMVIEKQKMWYFNLNPAEVNASGYCHQQDALLSLTLPDNAARLDLTFKKDGTVSYVSKLTAHISPQPLCKGCVSKDYPGVLANVKLFQATSGRSFKCHSQSVLVMAEQLSVKLGPVQIQAFSLPNGQYGHELECWADFNKRVIPIIIGSVVVGVLLIVMVTYLVVKDRRRQGYERI